MVTSAIGKMRRQLFSLPTPAYYYRWARHIGMPIQRLARWHMPSKSVEMGQEFEVEVHDVFPALQAKHLNRVWVADHLRMTLHDGQEVILDFILDYGMPDGGHVITIECQSRQRGQKDIANKIRTMKAMPS
jgi:hypothetical protein